MLTQTTAIVLHSFKLGESKIVVSLLTESGGRLDCVASVSRSARARLRKQHFQPMTILDISYEKKQRAQLQKLSEAHIAVPYLSLQSNPCKVAINLFLSEFLYHATRAEQHNPNLFAYVANSMRWLDGCEHSFANFHLVFMMRLTRFIGFFPNTQGYRAGDIFDMRQATFTPLIPRHRDYLSGSEAERITTLMRMNYDTMHLFRMSRQERNRIVAVILHYYRLHLPDFPELHSHAIMQEVMDAQ